MIGRRREGTLVVQTAYLGNVVLTTPLLSALAERHGPDDVVLGRDDLLCRPCAQPGPAVCPLNHHRCMRELDIATVADALGSVLRRVEERRAIRTGH